MGDNGFFRVDRRIWEHPALADRRPFSRREAWLWLISAAVWKPCRVRVGGRSIELQRGELAYSMRFLADRWGWPKSNVARFVDRLQLESMIGTDCPAQFGTATRTGVTVITICNYDKYHQRTHRDSNRNTRSGSKLDIRGTASGTANNRRNR